MAKRTESNCDTTTSDMTNVLNSQLLNENIAENLNRAVLGRNTTDHDYSDDDTSDEDDVLGDDSLSKYASLEEVNDDSSLLLRDLDCSDGLDIKSLEMSPETNAKFQALLDAAGIGQFPSPDGRPLADPEVIRQLSNSVSCALDEAAAAIGKLGDPDMIEDVARGAVNAAGGGHPNGAGVGCTPTTLAQACVEGNLALVKQMLSSGADPDEITQDGETPLTMAVTAGFTEVVDVLLKNRANPNLRGSKAECTALMEAASAGYVEIVFMLLQNSADVNAVSSTGNTALHYACCGGHEECLLVLLDHSADVEVQNENGHTALMEAASGGHVNLARHLLKHGAGINTHSTEFKESALTLACYKGHLEMVKFLLDSGADHEHKTDEMHTALMEAAMDGHVEVARLLLAHGAHVNMPADSFESPLTLAACGGHTELASLLLGHGADLEEVNDEGYTPLMEAAREGHDEMVALLLAHGAEVNAQTQETQETALTLAACGGFVDVAELLLRCNADIELGSSTPLMEAAQEGHVDLVKRLLAQGAKVNAETVTGDTALHYACENDHEEVCKILLDHGADLEHCSEGGRTPLMKAARAGKLRCVRLFISRGANVNRATTNNEYTALSLACANGHLLVVDCLLKAGSDPKQPLRDGNTLLIEAAKGGHTDVVRLLLDFPHVDAETVQAQSVQAAAAAQASSASAVPGGLPLTSANAGSVVGPTSGTVADRLPAEGLPSIVPPPPPNAASSSSILDANGGPSKVAPPPLLPPNAAAAASASTGIRPAPQRAYPGYPTFAPPPPLSSASTLGSAAGDEPPWELTSAGGAGGLPSAVNVLDGLPTELGADYNIMDEFRQPDKLDEFLTRFMKIQEAANAAASAGSRRTLKQSEADSSVSGGLLSHTSHGAATSHQHPVALGSSPVQRGGTTAKCPSSTASTSTSSLPSSAIPLDPRNWDFTSSSLVTSQTSKFNLAGQSAGPLAQALSALQQTQQQQIQQQQQIPLSLSLHTGDVTSDTTASNVPTFSTSVPPPPPAITTSQLQQLEHQMLQSRQQIGDHVADPPLEGPLGGGITTCNAQVSASSTCVSSNGVNFGSLSSSTALTTMATTGCVNSNGSAATSSSTPCYSPHSPCYPHSPHQYGREPNIDINAFTESTAETALTLAAQGGYEDLVRLLLERGAYIEHRDNKGYTPLINAAINGHREVVRLLLDRHAKLEEQSDRTKDTALSLACSGGRYDVAELLLQRCANKEHRNVSDYTPLSLAASGGYVNIINLLLKNGAEINSRTGSKLGISPLMLAAMNGHKEAVRVLLDNGSDINAMIETNRNTALTLACFQGRHEVVALLLERKAVIEHRAKTGLTPLMEAASGGYVEVGRVLLEKGAEVNALPVPTSRDTALTIAADKGHTKFVQLLLEHGAQVEVKNKKGCSPLWLACNGGHLDVVQKLVQHGADVNSMDNRKTSCLMAAFRKGHLKVVKFLVKHVTQFPADSQCLRYIQTITDKELSKKCNTCMDIIVTAKDRQAAEANKNANNLLQELDNEKELVAKKQAALAKKREKKRQKRMKARERERERNERDGDDDDDAGSTIGGGLSSVVARGQSGFDADDLEPDVLDVAQDEAVTGERESGDGGEVEEEAGGKRYKLSVAGGSEVSVESLWSRLSPLHASNEAKGGSDQKPKKSSSQSSHRLTGSSSRKGVVSSVAASISTPGSSRRRTPPSPPPPPPEVPMGTPTATTAGTTGHNLTSTVVVSGGRLPRQTSNSNNNAANSVETVPSKINSNMTAVEKKAAMVRNKKVSKKAVGSPSAPAGAVSESPSATSVPNPTGSLRRRRGEQAQDKAGSRSPPPFTSAWATTGSSPASYSAAVASSSSSGTVNGDLPTKTPSWSAVQSVAQTNLSTTSTASSSPTTVLVSVSAVSLSQQQQQLQQSVSQPPQQPANSNSEPTDLHVFDIFTDTCVDDPEGGGGSLVSSPLASPGGPWITASSRNSQHSHGGGSGTAAAATAPAAGVSTASGVEHEWTTVAKRRISMPVSRREIGKVIGQSGNTINTIRQHSGAHIDIDNKESDNGERQVHIRGSLEAVNRAKMMIEHLINGKPLQQLLNMPITTGQSAVPLMGGVTTTSGSSRKGASSKTPGQPGTAGHASAASVVKGTKPLPIRQQSTRAAVILSTSGVATTRSSSTRKGTVASDAFLTTPAPSFNAWGGPTPAPGEASHSEMNFASVAAAGVVRPAPNASAAVANVSSTQASNIKPSASAPTKAISGFPTLSESLSLSSGGGISPTTELNVNPQPNPQLGAPVSQPPVQPPLTCASSTAVVAAVGKPISVTTARIAGQVVRDSVGLKASPSAADDPLLTLASSAASTEPRFHNETNIAIDNSGSTVGPSMPATANVQVAATISSTVINSTKSVFNRAPGSHRPKPTVVATTSTTTTTTTAIASVAAEPSVDLPPEPQAMSMATSLNLLTPPLSVAATTIAPTHTTSSRTSPSTSPFPTTSTPVSVSAAASQTAGFATPSTPLPSGSPPAPRSVTSPVAAPTETRPVQSLVAIVAPSITPTVLPPASTSLPLSNLTSSATCSTISPVNATPHVPTASAGPAMLAPVVSSVPAPIAPPVSYPQPSLASMMAPPGMVSNAANETGMTLPRISSLNPGANTFEPRAPNTLPLNMVQSAAQMMQSGPAQQQLHNSLRGSITNSYLQQQQQQQQQLLHFEALRMAGGGSGNNGNYSGSGTDPTALMGVRTNEAQLAAAAAAVMTRPMYGNMASTVGGNSSYFGSNTGSLGASMLNNASMYGGSQQQSPQQLQQQQQQHQHSGLVGNSRVAMRHLYQQPQQQLGSGGGDSGLNSPQQMMMLATDCLFNQNHQNIDLGNLSSGGNTTVDHHEQSYPFMMGTSSQTPYGAPGYSSSQDLMTLMNGMNSAAARGTGTSGGSGMTRPIGAERSMSGASNTMKSSNWANMSPLTGNGNSSGSLYGNANQQTSNLIMSQLNPGGSTNNASGGGGAYNWNTSWNVGGTGSGNNPHMNAAPSAAGSGWPPSNNLIPGLPNAVTVQSGWPSGGAGGEWPQTGVPSQQQPQRPQPQQQPSSHHLTDQ